MFIYFVFICVLKKRRDILIEEIVEKIFLHKISKKILCIHEITLQKYRLIPWWPFLHNEMRLNSLRKSWTFFRFYIDKILCILACWVQLSQQTINNSVPDAFLRRQTYNYCVKTTDSKNE